ncbi:hypothetical protein ACHMW6_00035 (plasmid) [Pseudoduganella sp. UC29_106]|uniref:hypothetical protein n=1 Tax=Pseudoduganella sp. UC29_106 TaxID=3374553 RepID=UPI0037563637
MDTARTLAEVEKTNPDKAKEIIEEGQRTGKVKRDAVREAHAEEKAKQGKGPKASKEAPKKDATDAHPPAANDATTGEKTGVAWPFPTQHNGAPKTPEAAAAKVEAADPAEKGKSPIVVSAYDVCVVIRPDSVAAANFDRDLKKHGPATLADEMVHSDTAMAWVHFGRGTDDGMLVPYPCADLQIQRIVRRD